MYTPNILPLAAVFAITLCTSSGAATQLTMLKATAAQTEAIKDVMGPDYVIGKGPFLPNLLVGEVDIDKDGRKDMITVQMGLCNNRWCDYAVLIHGQLQWYQLMSFASWSVPYLKDRSEPKTPPDIVIFEHLSDDCMACSPPTPVRITWDNTVYSTAGSMGAYVVAGPIEGHAANQFVPYVEESAGTGIETPDCAPQFTIDPLSGTGYFSYVLIEKRNELWSIEFSKLSRRLPKTISVVIDDKSYTVAVGAMEEEKTSDDWIGTTEIDNGDHISDIVASLGDGHNLTLRATVLNRDHYSTYSLKGSASAIRQMDTACQ
ncbi:MAG: hypothetical protein E5W97_29495 [Mesorhizobium sp.]|nr:MAG: hypothetical protein E5V41_03690 [Mesorhizobium sp.]TJW00622.1 MAG: hypothetical protein E5W97_29495 [Mesorhizobium sp.]